MLFGEWVAAVHSLEYPGLPDYFLVFDVYDRKARRFWSKKRRNELASRLGLPVCAAIVAAGRRTIHQLGAGNYRLNALKQMIDAVPSAYRGGGCEGINLRHEDQDWLIARAKLVHPDFVQSIGEHWRSRSLSWNSLGVDSAHACTG